MSNKFVVKLNYYNEEEKKLFRKNYADYEKIDSLIGEVEIKKAEFLTYMLFSEKNHKHNKPGFRTYDEISEKAQSRKDYFEDYLRYEGTRLLADGSYEDITERVGVSLSLCIANLIHDLHEADWEVIPVSPDEKSLDFKFASTGQYFVFIESKGSVVENNELKGNLSKQKNSIKEKKKAQRVIKKSPNDVFYGVIVSLDESNTAQCWLVDPIPPNLLVEPMHYQLLSRLYFYWRNLKGIIPGAVLLLSLINRIKIIEISRDYSQYNNIPLINKNGQELKVNSLTYKNKTTIEADNIFGELFPIDNETLFFMGFPKELLQILASQNFDKILNYKFKSNISSRTITCKVKKSDTILYNILMASSIKNLIIKTDKSINSEIQHENIDTENHLITFRITGKIAYTYSGRAFGIIKLREEYMER